jgi:hypothetical protein
MELEVLAGRMSFASRNEQTITLVGWGGALRASTRLAHPGAGVPGQLLMLVVDIPRHSSPLVQLFQIDWLVVRCSAILIVNCTAMHSGKLNIF